MTVQTQINKVTAPGNDLATTFSFSPMIVFEEGNVVAVLVDATGAETALTLGTGGANFSVDISTYPNTGSINYPANIATGTTLATGESIVITRVLTLEQQTDLENGGGYDPEVLEKALDKLLMIDLQQQQKIDRSVLFPVSLSISDNEATGYGALRYLRGDAAGTGIEFAAIATTDAAPSDVAPAAVSLSAAAAGSAADYAREDHAHLLSVSANIASLLGSANYAAARALLDLESGTDFNPLLTTVTQAAAEAGTATVQRLWTAQRVAQAIAALSPNVLPTGHKFGMQLSNNVTDANHDIDISAGSCRANTTDSITLTAFTKRIDATWASGTGNGGLSSSLTAPANATWYHVFAILVGGSADVGFDTSLTAANLVTDHTATAYRRLGSVLTDGSANILAFKQINGHFYWLNPVLDYNARPGATEVSTVLSVPVDVPSLAMLTLSMRGDSQGTETGTTADNYTAVYHPDITGAVAGAGDAVLRAYQNNIVAGAWGSADAYMEVYTDTASGIQHISTDDVRNLEIGCLGWIDDLGRSA